MFSMNIEKCCFKMGKQMNNTSNLLQYLTESEDSKSCLGTAKAASDNYHEETLCYCVTTTAAAGSDDCSLC